MACRLEHLSCEDRLRQLGLLGLKKRVPGLMLLHFQDLKSLMRKMKKDFLLGLVVTGQGVRFLN